MNRICSRRRLKGFLSDRLDLDNRLVFLLHVEDCPKCWEAVYHDAKAQHPEYYQSSPWRMRTSKRELSHPDTLAPELFGVA